MLFRTPFFHIVTMVIIIDRCEHVLLCHFTMLLYHQQLTMENVTGPVCSIPRVIHAYTNTQMLFIHSKWFAVLFVCWFSELMMVSTCFDFQVYSHNVIIQLKVVFGTHLQMTWFWLLLLLFLLLSSFFCFADVHFTLHQPTHLFSIYIHLQ